jgi:uncharacterized cupredoxin-like copper-binding protein
MRKAIQTMAVFTIGFGLTIGLSACGKDDKSSDSGASDASAASSETASTPTEAAPTGTEAATPTEAAAPPTEAAATPTEAAAGAAGTEAVAAGAAPAAAGANAYLLKEWTLEGSATLAPGKVDLSVVNGGKFPHELLVIKDTTYEDAPKDELGTVLEDKLPAGSILGETNKIEAGKTATLSVELAPGKYLFVCNIAVGPNSHAGKGQRLNVTVA